MSRDANTNSPGPVIRVLVPTRPASVRIFEGDRAQLVERRRQDELDQAFARGRAEGERSALVGAASALTLAADKVARAAELQGNELARDATRLAVEIARTLLRREIDAGRYDIERIVRETLAASGVGRGVCVVHLNPVDAKRLTEITFRAGTTIESDPEVPPGDVHITTHRGLLVRDVDQALASIAERLEGDAT